MGLDKISADYLANLNDEIPAGAGKIIAGLAFMRIFCYY